MDEILKKLTAGGVSEDIINKLKVGLGNTFETELVTNGLKLAAEKVGIDSTNLPQIDFHNISEAAQELAGKDTDGDGKTGVAEALENVEEAFKNSNVKEVKDTVVEGAQGFFAKIKGFFGGK
ncbi:hypothetical protein HOO68_02630 [Candidatus Gracilibacteria bacterium]|nr:hypothetical protein [Candidatus Gracilibacteria bacterium]